MNQNILDRLKTVPDYILSFSHYIDAEKRNRKGVNQYFSICELTPWDIYLSYPILRHCEGSCIMCFSMQHFPWFNSLNRRCQLGPIWVFKVYFMIFYKEYERFRTNWCFRWLFLIDHVMLYQFSQRCTGVIKHRTYITWWYPCENNGCDSNNEALIGEWKSKRCKKQ